MTFILDLYIYWSRQKEIQMKGNTAYNVLVLSILKAVYLAETVAPWGYPKHWEWATRKIIHFQTKYFYIKSKKVLLNRRFVSFILEVRIWPWIDFPAIWPFPWIQSLVWFDRWIFSYMKLNELCSCQCQDFHYPSRPLYISIFNLEPRPRFFNKTFPFMSSLGS